MLFVRWIFLSLLLAAVLFFALYAITGKERYRRFGLITLRWTVVGALGFFAALAFERLA